MDEISWRVKLAKANINILSIETDKDADTQRWYYEFQYHPAPGQTKWCKTFFDAPYDSRHMDRSAYVLLQAVLELRQELEG